MNTNTSSSGSRVYNIVESVILGVCVLLITWTAQTVIAQGKLLSSHDAALATSISRLTSIEDRGSRSLESHSKLDDNRDMNMMERMVKLETAILNLQAIVGEMKALGVQLDALHAGQIRIEKQIAKP